MPHCPAGAILRLPPVMPHSFLEDAWASESPLPQEAASEFQCWTCPVLSQVLVQTLLPVPSQTLSPVALESLMPVVREPLMPEALESCGRHELQRI